MPYNALDYIRWLQLCMKRKRNPKTALLKGERSDFLGGLDPVHL